MGTCVICHIAYDPCWDEEGNELLDPYTSICNNCKKKIEKGEIEVESYDKYSINDKLEVD